MPEFGLDKAAALGGRSRTQSGSELDLQEPLPSKEEGATSEKDRLSPPIFLTDAKANLDLATEYVTNRSAAVLVLLRRNVERFRRGPVFNHSTLGWRVSVSLNSRLESNR